MPKKVALITGASSDIGVGLVKKMLSLEFEVYGQYNSNIEALKQFKHDNNFTLIKQDLGSIEQAAELIPQVTHKNSQLDILINAIGPLDYKPIYDMTPFQWQQQIHFNLSLSFYLAHCARDFLVSSQGHIVNFAFAGAESLCARVNATPYCAAKAGVVILTKSLAQALAPYHVRVNAISPGLIEAGAIQSPVRKTMAESIPFGRPGTPSEVAEVLSWLVCASPSYITGALIPVAGAWEYL